MRKRKQSDPFYGNFFPCITILSFLAAGDQEIFILGQPILFSGNLIDDPPDDYPDKTQGSCYTNTFTFKGISLSTLIDFKLGHKMIAGSNMNYLRHGLHKRTLVGRAEGYVIGQGVNPGGEINTTRSPVQPFYEWANGQGVYEDFVFNAGFWKLRQVTMSYDFSRHLPQNLFIKGLKLSAVANNVAVLKKWTENMDPEQVVNTSDNATGLDFWPSMPLTRSIGFNLNARF